MRWPLRLLLVRHGQVASNREMRYVGTRDEPLTELGKQQARSVGEALWAKGKIGMSIRPGGVVLKSRSK